MLQCRLLEPASFAVELQAMGSSEDAKALAVIAAAPELATPEETEAFLNAMPIGELASLWCVVQCLSRRDQTGGAWAAIMISTACRMMRRTARSILRSKSCAANPTSSPSCSSMTNSCCR